MLAHLRDPFGEQANTGVWSAARIGGSSGTGRGDGAAWECGVTLAGCMAGLIGSVALARVIRTLRYGVSPTEPFLYPAAAFALIPVGVLASAYRPFVRAVSIR